MGKIDDMRKLREQQDAERDANARPQNGAAKPAPKGEQTQAPRASKKASDDDAIAGKCSVCGKSRPLSAGLVGDHQKGLGKFCAGSRKPPA